MIGCLYVYLSVAMDKAKIHNLPTVYDDIVKSGYYEDYDWKHHWDKESQSQGE